MKFWDSSALVPLVVDEDATDRMEIAYQEDTAVVVWCLTAAEIWSAVARKRRERRLTSPQTKIARNRLERLAGDWAEVVDLIGVRGRVHRLLDQHALRTGDALQLAAALLWTRDRPDGAGFVTLDDRLAAAAMREGFATGIP